MAALLLTGGDISLQQKAALDQAEQVLVQAKNGRITIKLSNGRTRWL